MNQGTQALNDLLQSFSSTLPHFPDGRIDYSQTDTAAVITVFIFHEDDLLLMKRSEKVRTYKKKWNTVAGYLDDPTQNLEEKTLEELYEETKITKDEIKHITYGRSYQFTDDNIHRTWIVFPVKVMLSKKPVITLDWEHTTYQWIHPPEIDRFDTVPQLKKSLTVIS